MDFKNLGTIEFQAFLEIQAKLAEDRKRDKVEDTVLFAEHPVTVSLKRQNYERELDNLRCPPEILYRNKIPIVKAERGGLAAVHGPGILGCYFIVKLNEPLFSRGLLSALKPLARRVLGRSGILADELPDSLKTDRKAISKYTGLWVWQEGEAPKKIVAMGIFVSQKVTSFGMNINVCPEDWILKLIHPCGIKEYELTSVKNEGGNVNVDFARENLTELAPQYFPRFPQPETLRHYC